MKKLNIYIIAIALFAYGCDATYTDDIVPVAAGPDEEAPKVVINFPLDGTLIRVPDAVTNLNINFEVSDDIEIESVIVRLNGDQLLQVTEFIDYRRLVRTFNYDQLGNGEHVLAIEAKDLSGKTTIETVNFEKVEPYDPIYDGEIFYLPFDGDYLELVSVEEAAINGSPGFASGIKGRAYQGSSSGYLTFPTDGLRNQEFSAAFWYKVNPSPNRAGILVMGPPDPNNPTNQNFRNHGFRLFREAAGSMQRVKLNVGNGSGDNWFDGGAAADIDPSKSEWVHIAISISGSSVAVYLDGQVASQGTFAGIDWTGCDLLSIGSGAPRFSEWGHLSTQSLIDELRIFSKALTQAEIQVIIDTDRP